MGAPQIALNPELLEGAWAANAPRLSEILADYELTAKLASTYGRTEELRWRLRQRTALIAVDGNLAVVDALLIEQVDVAALGDRGRGPNAGWIR